MHDGKRLHAKQVMIPDTYNQAMQTEFKDYRMDAMVT